MRIGQLSAGGQGAHISRRHRLFEPQDGPVGVHAAAVIKALNRGDNYLANRVYSGVPADDFGLEQKIAVGPMSGKSNVVFWLKKHGYEATEATVDALFEAAKNSSRVLADEVLHDLAKQNEQPA